MDELTGRRMIEMLPRLRRFAYGMCGNLDDADDLVQLTCQRAIARFDQWRPGTSLTNWLFAIARNAYFDQQRGHKIRAGHAKDAGATQERAVDGERTAEHAVLMSRLVAHMAGMAEDLRSALLLALVEGLSYQEIADIQNVPLGTVTSRIGRARQILRQALDDTETAPNVNADHKGARTRGIPRR